MSRHRIRVEFDHALSRTVDAVIAHAELIVGEGALIRVPVEYIDPARQWLRPRDRPMARIKDVGMVALMDSPRKRCLSAMLFDPSNGPTITQRRLVYTKSRTTLVWFGDEFDAANRLADVIESGGALPPEWSWDPPAKFGYDDWVPRRLTRFEVRCGTSAYQWQGATAKWTAQSSCGTHIVKCNGHCVEDKLRRRYLMFSTMGAAKAYCMGQDSARQSAGCHTWCPETM
jgi:hypothetical protein